MKKTILLSLLAVIALTSACTSLKENVKAEKFDEVRTETEKVKKDNLDTVVLVELFTSEGCSSCPPADIALAKLKSEQPIENTEIIALAFHVDYWNYLGWKDEFSSEKYSQRQTEYAHAFRLNSNYTPQMVVDGKYEFIGSKYSNAISEIRKASKDTKAKVELKLKKALLKPSLEVRISDLDSKEDSKIFLAVSEDNITTNVKRGENKGRKLSHVSVVREFEQIGYVSTGVGEFTTEKSIKLDSKWNKENLSLVVFVQNKNSKNVIGVGKTQLQ